MEVSAVIHGADTGTRTPDPRITNALLYQLSHVGMVFLSKPSAKVVLFLEMTNKVDIFFSRKHFFLRFVSRITLIGVSL